MSFSSFSSLSSFTELESTSFVSTSHTEDRRRNRTKHRTTRRSRSRSRSRSRTRTELSTSSRRETTSRHTSDSNGRAHTSHKSHRRHRDEKSPSKRTSGSTTNATSDRRKHRQTPRSRSRDHTRRAGHSSRRHTRHSYPESSLPPESPSISSFTEGVMVDLDPEPSSFSELDLSELPPGSGHAYVQEEGPKICKHCHRSPYQIHGRTDVLPALQLDPYSAYLAAYRLTHLDYTRPPSPSPISPDDLYPELTQPLPLHLLPALSPVDHRARRLALALDSDCTVLSDWATEEYVKLGPAGRRLVRSGVFEVKLPGADYDDGVDLGREEREEERMEYEWAKSVFEEGRRRGDGYREVDEMFRRAAGVLNDLLEWQEMRERGRLELGDESRDLSEWVAGDGMEVPLDGLDVNGEVDTRMRNELPEILEESDGFDRLSNETLGRAREFDQASRSPSRSPSIRGHRHRRSPSPEPPTPITESSIDTLDTLESSTMSPASDMPYGIEIAGFSPSIAPTPLSPELPVPPPISSWRAELVGEPAHITQAQTRNRSTTPIPIPPATTPVPTPAPSAPVPTLPSLHRSRTPQAEPPQIDAVSTHHNSAPRSPSPSPAPPQPVAKARSAPKSTPASRPSPAPTPPPVSVSAPAPSPPIAPKARSARTSGPTSRPSPVPTPKSAPAPTPSPPTAPLIRPPLVSSSRASPLGISSSRASPPVITSSQASLPMIPSYQTSPSPPPPRYTSRAPQSRYISQAQYSSFTYPHTASVHSSAHDENEDIAVPSDLEGSDGGLTTPGGSPRSRARSILSGGSAGRGGRRRRGYRRGVGSGLTTPDRSRSPVSRSRLGTDIGAGTATGTGTETETTMPPIPVLARGGQEGVFRLRGGAMGTPEVDMVSDIDAEADVEDEFEAEAGLYQNDGRGRSQDEGISVSMSPPESDMDTEVKVEVEVDMTPRPPPPSPEPSFFSPTPRVPTNIPIIPPLPSPPPSAALELDDQPPLPPIQFWLPTYPSFDSASMPHRHSQSSAHKSSSRRTKDKNKSRTERPIDPLGNAPPPVFIALGARRACIPYTPAFQGLDLRVVRPVSAREKLVVRDAVEILGRLGAKVKGMGMGMDEEGREGVVSRKGEMWSLSYVGW